MKENNINSKLCDMELTNSKVAEQKFSKVLV